MRYRILIAACLVIAALAACNTKEGAQEEPNKAPKVEFSVKETALDVLVESSVGFNATIVEGKNVKCSWTVDGELVASTPSLTWVFNNLGEVIISFEAENELGKVRQDYTVNVAGLPLDVTYSVEEDVIQAVIGTPVSVSVTVNDGDRETVHAWLLDGEDAGSGLAFSKTFEEKGIGTHTLAYHGRNMYGMTASKTWSVEVADLPLEVNYSPSKTELEAMVGDNVNFTVSIVHGAIGASIVWKLDDVQVEVEDPSKYTYTGEAEGTHTISVTITNAAGESDSRSWTLTVVPKTEKTLLFDNFESAEVGVNAYYIGNNVGGVSILQTVENPYKTDANSSDKVLVDKGSMMTNTSSGYFKFKIDKYPDGTTAISADDRALYTRFRCKVYIGSTGFTPLLQEDNKSTKSTPSEINGIPFNTTSPTLDAWNAAIKTNDWNVFVYDFTNPKYSSEVNNLSQTNQLQFRVFVDFNNNGKAGQDVYFDDFEFLE